MTGTGTGGIDFCLPELFGQLGGLRFDLRLVGSHLILLCLEFGQHGVESDVAGRGSGRLGSAVGGPKPSTQEDRTAHRES